VPARATRSDAVTRAPRERLLQAAGELFYAEGVQSVGVDRVIARAGVAKASLYSTFGSKEQLICAYLEDRHAATLARLRDAVAGAEDPVSGVIAVFDAQAEAFANPEFHGCAFASAAAEAPSDGLVRSAVTAYRRDLGALFRELAAAAGAADPQLLARQLQAVYDGAGLAARLDGLGGVATAARAAATALVAAALAPDAG
jgi:AcrR family transcriptional regulator